MSVICALTVAPGEQGFGLYYDLLDHNCHAVNLMAFLRFVHSHLRRSMLLVWDRLNAHRSAAAQLERARCSWLRPRWLPSYAPELDPVEFVWTQSKYADLANRIPEDLDDLHSQLVPLLEEYEYRHDPARLRSFFRIAQLPM